MKSSQRFASALLFPLYELTYMFISSEKNSIQISIFRDWKMEKMFPLEVQVPTTDDRLHTVSTDRTQKADVPNMTTYLC